MIELARETLARLADVLPDPVVVADPAGRVVLAGDRVRALGWDPQELPGRGLSALLGAHPERGRWSVRVDGQELSVVHLRGRGSEGRTAGPAPELAPGGRAILIVEDDDEVRGLVGEYVRLLGHVAIETRGPLEALRVLEERGSRVDVLLTDVLLPFLSGAELIELARRICPELPVVTMSGYAPPAGTEQPSGPAQTIGLPKPFTLAQLRAALERASPAGAQ